VCLYLVTRRHFHIKVAKEVSGNVAEFKYLGTKVTGQNCVRCKIKSKLNSLNVTTHAVQNFLSSCPLSESILSYNLHLGLYGCENLSRAFGTNMD
jgi:hypothetical protein